MIRRGMRAYSDFRNAVGFKESSDRYNVVNSFGYMGRYQFGTPRLSDFGLCTRKPGSKGFANADFEWVAPFTQKDFLSTPPLQDACFDLHVWRLQEWVQTHYGSHLGKTVNGILFTLSGAVACCHLLGPGGVEAFFKGVIQADANGVKSTDYMTKFGGYEPLTQAPDHGAEYLKSLLTTNACVKPTAPTVLEPAAPVEPLVTVAVVDPWYTRVLKWLSGLVGKRQ